MGLFNLIVMTYEECIWDMCETSRQASMNDIRRQRHVAILLSKQEDVNEKTRLLYEEEAERWDQLLYLLKEYPSVMAVVVTLRTVGDDIKDVTIN